MGQALRREVLSARRANGNEDFKGQNERNMRAALADECAMA
jgi:hypothetical protein